DPIEAPVAVLVGGRVVAVELSTAAGLAQLAPERRDPLVTTTYGVGQLIKAAYERHPFQRLFLALGGSATVDGGAGLLEALGVKLLDAAGRPIPRGGGGLGQLATIDLSEVHPALRAQIIVAVDVDNPLLGPLGAAPVYGPQKGATHQQVELLAANLTIFADALVAATGNRVHDLRGAGSAGGVPAGLVAIAQAEMTPGFELAAQALDLDDHLDRATVVFTGEGQLDGQSFQGKVVGRLAARCHARGIPLVALVGRIDPVGERMLEDLGGVAFSLVPGPMSYEEALRQAPELLEAIAARAARLLKGP
ncbi:MAG: glycerate kinase, partial [Cyanobacteria bacterium RYN_339]|nr:glycerate kinase [Cyanobacteria bacterium RYN_339]